MVGRNRRVFAAVKQLVAEKVRKQKQEDPAENERDPHYGIYDGHKSAGKNDDQQPDDRGKKMSEHKDPSLKIVVLLYHVPSMQTIPEDGK